MRFLDRGNGLGEFFGTCSFRDRAAGNKLTIAFLDEQGVVIDSYTEEGLEGPGMVKVFLLPIDASQKGEVVLRLEQTYSPEQS